MPQFPHLQEGRDGAADPGDAAAAPLLGHPRVPPPWGSRLSPLDKTLHTGLGPHTSGKDGAKLAVLGISSLFFAVIPGITIPPSPSVSPKIILQQYL